MIHVASVLERWVSRREEWQRFDVQVNGSTVAQEIIDDLEALARGAAEELLSLEEAARRSGYTADHLGALVRAGKLTNHGRKGAPRVRWADVPRKLALTARPSLAMVALADRRQIARSVLSGTEEGHDGT